LFDDNDCREFIQKNFKMDVLNAFDTLIPGAYKADLWRYCVLYILGGIYIDIKYIPMNGFKFISLTEKEHWVLDMDNNGIYNALIAAKPGNAILLQAINNIVANVQNRYYGNSCLEPTGPLLLAKLFSSEQKQAFDMKHTFYISMQYRFILFNNYHVFKSYYGYMDEHAQNQKVPHYSILWGQHNIYK
jgi:mannosyltransferase OCH1-like enzyme